MALRTIPKAQKEIALKIARKYATYIRPSSITWEELYNDFDKTEAKKIAMQLGLKVKVTSGCYRIAMVGEKFVFKMAYDSRQEEIASEADYIKKMRKHPKYGRHFPVTEYVTVKNKGMKIHVQIQETVRTKFTRLEKDLCVEVYDLADKLGIEDCHRGNFGWKGSAKRPYPVFIDVDFRLEPELKNRRKRRSWMVD